MLLDNSTACCCLETDNRNFAIVNSILTQNNITSNWKYRQYIQKNAQQIMKYNSMSAIYASGNNTYANDSGYTRPVSDLKDNYLQQEQMKMRMVAPSINTKFF